MDQYNGPHKPTSEIESKGVCFVVHVSLWVTKKENGSYMSITSGS